MKTIALKPRKVTASILLQLEKCGVIKTFTPSPKVLKLKKGTDGAVETIYTTAPRYGTHKLICVGKNATDIVLTTHPDSEDFLIINTTAQRHKPLYLIVGLYKQKEFERRARKGLLGSKDILALELEYNSALSAFTMLKDTPHCEVTVPGKGMHPVFFVTEPSDFAMCCLELPDYKFILKP